MPELTKEYFEEYLGNQINGLEGKMKGQINNEINSLEIKLSKELDAGFEKISRMVTSGFVEVKWRLDVSEKVQRLETDMARIKGSINIK